MVANLGVIIRDFPLQSPSAHTAFADLTNTENLSARHGVRRRKGRTDVPKIVNWHMDGKINIDGLITPMMPLKDINSAFDLMHERKSIRTVVEY